MTEIKRYNISIVNGFWPTAALTGPFRVPDSARDGRNFWFLGAGLSKSAKGTAASGGGLGTRGASQLYPVALGTNTGVGALTSGSVIPYRSGLYLFAGSGSVTVLDQALGTASSTLQYNDSPGNPGSAHPVGLTQPSAPGAAAGAAGINTGSYAVVITAVRTVTGGESIGSLPSAPVALKSQAIRVTFPMPQNATQDQWNVYFTQKGRGSTGPFFYFGFVTEQQVATSAIGGRQLDFSFYDSQLAAVEPPTDYNPPPVCTFVASLGPEVIALGTFAGSTGASAGVSPSVPNKLDAYPALYTTFLNPYETIVGFASRPTEGELILWTKNSLQALVLTGSPSFPILPRAIWPTTGIQSPHGGCFADSIFYGYSGSAGPVRMGGDDPDTTFARQVYEFFRTEGWDPSTVVVGYDRIRDAVIYMGSGASGNLAVPFMRSAADGGYWSVPINLPGAPQACVTINGQLKISIGGTLYDWEQGTGLTATFTPAWQDAPDPANRKTFVGYRTTVDTGSASLQLDLLTDLSDTPVTGATQTSSGTGPRQTAWKRTNKRCRTFTIKPTVTGPDYKIHDIEVEVFHEPNLRES